MYAWEVPLVDRIARVRAALDLPVSKFENSEISREHKAVLIHQMCDKTAAFSSFNKIHFSVIWAQ